MKLPWKQRWKVRVCWASTSPPASSLQVRKCSGFCFFLVIFPAIWLRRRTCLVSPLVHFLPSLAFSTRKDTNTIFSYREALKFWMNINRDYLKELLQQVLKIKLILPNCCFCCFKTIKSETWHMKCWLCCLFDLKTMFKISKTIEHCMSNLVNL